MITSSTEKMSDHVDDPETAAAPVPAPGQVMDAIDLPRRFAAAHVGTEDALNALECCEKSVRPLLTKRTQAKAFLPGNKSFSPRTPSVLF